MFCDFVRKLNKVRFDKKEFIEWYSDEKLAILFSEIPEIENKIINKRVMTKEEIKKAKKKPLFCNNEVVVILIDYIKCKNYKFVVNSGYDYDGATIHKFFWRLIGAKEDIRFKVASLIHDILCENHSYINNDRYFADKVFERCLFVSDTCSFVRWLMFHSVDNYQKIRGKWK